MIFNRTFIGVLYVFGLSIISIYAYETLDSFAKHSTKSVQDDIEHSLGEIENYYSHGIEPYLPVTTCNNFLEQTKPILLTDPYIRSISVSTGETLTCSSISGTKKYKHPYWQPTENKLTLLFTKQTPYKNHSLLNKRGILLMAFRPFDNKKYGVYISLYPDLFFQRLENNSFFKTEIRFSNALFSSDHKIIEISPAQQMEHPYFTVSYSITKQSFLRYTFNNYGLIIILWTIVLLLGMKSILKTLNTFNIDYWRIRSGLKKKQFHPYLQPVVRADGSIYGAEVLARWVHPKKGIIPPSQFVDIAEENGQIVQITSQLIEKCSQALKHAKFPADFPIRLGINACPMQFDTPQLFLDLDQFQHELSQEKVALIIEITERQEFTDNNVYVSSIEKLKQRDIGIALDDFGTGHCSLKYLYQANVDVLKIDKAYVSTIDQGPNTNLLENIIDLAKRVDVLLLAEGVETQEQLDYLKERNIDTYQGFFFDKPMPINEFIAKYLH